MSSFTNHTAIKPCQKKRWINTQRFRFHHNDEYNGLYDDVEAGFEFDGCSIPFCIFGQKVEPDTITSCCLHDWYFKNKKYSFNKSNYLFLIALRVEGVKPFKRLRYYLGVTLFGWFSRFRLKDKIKHYIKVSIEKIKAFIDLFRGV